MAALTADIKTVRYGVGADHEPGYAGVTSAVTIYGGSIAVLRSGFLNPPTTSSTTDIVMGLVERQTVGGSTNGAVTANFLRGTFFVSAGTGGDALSTADIGAQVFLIDEHTVGKTSGSSTRSVAGTLMQIDTTQPGGYAVALGTPAPGTG